MKRGTEHLLFTKENISQILLVVTKMFPSYLGSFNITPLV